MIYRLKVETLFILDKIKESRMQRLRFSEEVPLLLEMPFRQEVYSTSLEDLVSTLESILEDIIRGRRKHEQSQNMMLEPIVVFEPDKFLNKIAELVNDFRMKVLSILRERGQFLFSEFATGDVLERTQYFIFLLFLAMEDTVRLEQTTDDDFAVFGVPVTTV